VLEAGCAALYNDNHSTQARRLREFLIPIDASFAETARWKRRVPRARRKNLTPSPNFRKTWLIPRMMIPLPANIIFYTGEFNSI
jgi:hypothetical protein